MAQKNRHIQSIIGVFGKKNRVLVSSSFLKKVPPLQVLLFTLLRKYLYMYMYMYMYICVCIYTCVYCCLWRKQSCFLCFFIVFSRPFSQESFTEIAPIVGVFCPLLQKHHVYTRIFICIYVYVNVFVCVYMYVYAYVHGCV